MIRLQKRALHAAPNIDQRADFDLIRYANCWEDADILCSALEPRSGKRILSIASAGDNTLALLADGAEVVAADVSLAQLACLEIRCAAFRRLEYRELLEFLGVQPSSRRKKTYLQLERDLSSSACHFWRRNMASVEAGVIHAGKFENFFRVFRRRVLPFIHRRRTIDALLTERDQSARRNFYEGTWNNLRWQFLFRMFFSRFMLGRLGRDAEFFRYVEGSVANRLLTRVGRALTELPTHRNPYLEYIVNGNFQKSLPRYLRPENFQPIRAGLDRLTLFHGTIEHAAETHGQDRFDGFNLSDVFEYLDSGHCARIYETLIKTANPGARFAYWNMLAPRNCPDELSDRVVGLTEISRQLLLRDQAFFYSAFVLEEVA